QGLGTLLLRQALVFEIHISSPAVQRRKVGVYLDGPIVALDRPAEIAPLLLDLGQRDKGAEVAIVELDGILEIGGGPLRDPALEPHEAAIAQELVPEVSRGPAGQEIPRPSKIFLRGPELERIAGGRLPRLVAIVRGDQGRSEAAEHVKPGEV